MLRPCGHKLLIKQVELKKMSEGGIILHYDNEKMEKAGLQSGTIVAVGPSCWKAWREIDENGVERNGRPWAVVGDEVIYAKFGGQFITDPDDEEEYILLNDEDLHLVVERTNG